jgi:hypothetical protein
MRGEHRIDCFHLSIDVFPSFHLRVNTLGISQPQPSKAIDNRYNNRWPALPVTDTIVFMRSKRRNHEKGKS